jgi:TonB family protein
VRVLVAWILGGLLLVALAFGGIGYRAGWFNRAFDGPDQPPGFPEETTSPPEGTSDLETLVADAGAAYQAQNYGNAFALFQQAAERGSAEAQFRLGAMYLEGRGVAPDTTEAEKWFRRAADQGHVDARQALALPVETKDDPARTPATEAHEDAAEANVPGPAPPAPPDEEAEPDVYFSVDQMPELIGGSAALEQELRYPEQARRHGVEGSVIVKFVVDAEGRVVDPVVERGLGFGCDDEALRVVRQARFRPGRHHGQPVKVQQSLTITFRLK